LQRVNFYFQNTRQWKDYLFWMTCVGSLIRKLDFQKIFSKTDNSLISFQRLDLNRHDLWNIRFDSRTRKIVEQRRTSVESAKSLTWNDINFSQHSFKIWDTLGQYNGTWKGKTISIQISWGAKKDDSIKNQWTEDNMVQRKIINERAHSDHTRGNIV